ncbi:MAG: hypothetical protein ACC628_01595 [Pirellulaceae bacterium]
MTDSPRKLGKLQITNLHPSEDKGETVEAVCKVNVPNYVPDGVQLRARIDTTMFTATMPSCDVEKVQSDPQVESVEISKRLRIID